MKASRLPTRFRSGRAMATPAALATLQEHNITPLSPVARHVSGDFGIYLSLTTRPTSRPSSWVAGFSPATRSSQEATSASGSSRRLTEPQPTS